ncbi:hypothetical protein LPB87_11985 [Flavobacterium sp. EDS]|uniref:hypothetical protein n=1 Tax=Flavobacterium sp. EDS TaxID=2897328 RepID=UPI001E5888CD|nr:hypothetical protein [Flavobacterium sp. EDS]MCD0475113.1 hypothetical protein [Flavobacterium sp. EDS]
MIADPCYYCPDEEEPTGGSGGFPGTPLREVIIKSPSSPPSFPPMTFIPRGPSYGGVINPSEYTNPPRGGGGSSGGSTTNPADSPPPSCESFNFTAKKGANWQEALIKNISFKVVLLTPPNHVQITQIINYPQPISFGMPINFNKGNGDVSSGVAATVSARILQLAMDETIAKFGKTEVSELTVRLYFQEKLIKEYRDYTNGGIVNFNSYSNLTATQYKTNPLSSGNCD